MSTGESEPTGAMEVTEEQFVAIVGAIINLMQDLRTAKALRAAEAENPDRLAASAAIMACVRFIRGFEDFSDEGLQKPLNELALALLDLDTGYVAPMLQKRKSEKGGAPFSMTKNVFRGYVAALMGGLMKHAGMTEKEAAKEVAREMKRVGYLDIRAQTVDGWRKEAMDRPKDWIGDRYASVLAGADWTDPLEQIKRGAARLADQFPPRPAKG